MAIQKALVTGGAGFLGSRLVADLMEQGTEVVCIVRGDNPPARIQEKLDFWKVKGGRITVIRGDLAKDHCGITRTDANLLTNVTHVLHSAATLDFASSHKEATVAANVGGTKNILSLLSACIRTLPLFGFISTAYVCGKKDVGTIVSEDAPWETNPNNPYEESKRISEGIVRASGLPFCIFRPSVIVGDANNGKALTFQGYYTFLWILIQMKQRMIVQITKKAAEYAAAGICYDAVTDVLTLPVRLSCKPNATINIVTVNDVARMIVSLMQKSEGSGKIFHLTHPNPPTTKFLFDSICRDIGVVGVQVVDVRGASAPNPIIARIEKRLREMWESYNSYLFGEPQFDDTNVRALLDGQGEHTPITDELMRVINNFAIKAFQDGKIAEA